MDTAANLAIQSAPVEDNSETEDESDVRFTAREWKYFKLEVEDMIKSDRKFSFEKAIRNARYLAEVDRRIEEVESGKCVEHELIKVDGGE